MDKRRTVISATQYAKDLAKENGTLTDTPSKDILATNTTDEARLSKYSIINSNIVHSALR